MRWWTAPEDGQRGLEPAQTLHKQGQAGEFVRIEMAVKVPWYRSRGIRLVARAYQETGDVTLAFEAIRVESDK